MTKALLGLLAAGVAVAGLATAHVVAASSGVPPGHIGICHHTGFSPVHEWIYITPSADGVLDGHGQVRHQFQEDIIPPFVLVKPHGTVSFPGLNLTERIGADLEPDPNGPYTGAQILAAGCVAPTPTGTTGTTTTVATGTTSTTTVTTPGSTSTATVTTPGSTSTVTVTQPSTTTITVPTPKPACTRVTVRPGQLHVGEPTNLKLTVTRAGRKVAGVRVRIRGPHLHAVTGPSDHAGIIRRHVLMKSPGIVRFTPVATHSCGTKRVGVTGVFTPPVTG